MIRNTLLIVASAALLTTAACVKPHPVQTAKSDPTPVAPAPTPTQPLAQRTSPPVATPTPQRTETPAPRQMTPAEREALNAKLSRLEDALFDYDKASIRDDARTRLRDDVGVIRDILA